MKLRVDHSRNPAIKGSASVVKYFILLLFVLGTLSTILAMISIDDRVKSSLKEWAAMLDGNIRNCLGVLHVRTLKVKKYNVTKKTETRARRLGD